MWSVLLLHKGNSGLCGGRKYTALYPEGCPVQDDLEQGNMEGLPGAGTDIPVSSEF